MCDVGGLSGFKSNLFKQRWPKPFKRVSTTDFNSEYDPFEHVAGANAIVCVMKRILKRVTRKAFLHLCCCLYATPCIWTLSLPTCTQTDNLKCTWTDNQQYSVSRSVCNPYLQLELWSHPAFHQLENVYKTVNQIRKSVLLSCNGY